MNIIIKSTFISLTLSLVLFQTQATAEEAFGRLFTKPAERNNLDSLRQNQKLQTAKINTETADDEEAVDAELPSPITLQGYVKRSDGQKSTLWINDKAVQEDSDVDNVQVGRISKRGANADGLDIKIPANGKHVRLKAGQMYEPETNQIKELQVVEKQKRLNLEETGYIGEAEQTVKSSEEKAD